VQKTDWREGQDARATGSAGSAWVGATGTSSVEALSVGGTPAPLPVGAWGTEAGVGLAAETRQQEALAGACSTLSEGARPFTIGQWGVQSSAAAMCNQHEATAETGIASTTITSAEATSLNRHVMLLMILPGPCLHEL
jgi:hypothetical protein